jgi:hypothetical protein
LVNAIHVKRRSLWQFINAKIRTIDKENLSAELISQGTVDGKQINEVALLDRHRTEPCHLTNK